MQFTFTASHVQRHAAALLRTELRLKDFGACCPVAALLAVVFAACCRLGSLFAAARRLAAAPSHETVRQALLSNPPDLDTLERRLNHASTADLPRSLTRRRPRLASDLTLLPYHGQAATDPHEWVRGQAKSGATHFHAYATAYVVLHGQRFTVATTYVRQGEKAEKVLQRLLRRRAQGGVRPSLLLLDRGFWNEARVVTCSRSPSVRLFLVGVALVLRNVWVGLHHAVSSAPAAGGAATASSGCVSKICC